MTIEQALYNYLSTYAGLVALVGTRVYPLQPPQNATRPYVVYHKVGGQRLRTYQTPQLGGEPRFDFACTGDAYLDAKNVAVQVQLALETFTAGVMGGGPTVLACDQQNEVDMYNPETKLYHTVLDFVIRYQGA